MHVNLTVIKLIHQNIADDFLLRYPTYKQVESLAKASMINAKVCADI